MIKLETELEVNAVTIKFLFVLTVASVYMAPRNRVGVGLEIIVVGMLQHAGRRSVVAYTASNCGRLKRH